MKQMSRKIQKIQTIQPEYPNYQARTARNIQPEIPEKTRIFQQANPEDRKFLDSLPQADPAHLDYSDQMRVKYSKKCTAANDTDTAQVEEVEQSDSAAGYMAPPPEPVAATVLTEQQFYDLFQGCFSGMEWIVNKRLAPEGIKLNSIHIMEHEQATARGLCSEIYKIASEPGSPVAWMIAPPTKYGPLAILGFNFVMLKKETISEELRALRAKDVTPDNPDNPDNPPGNPDQKPENPENSEKTEGAQND